MKERSANGWVKILVPVLLVPALMIFAALVGLFSRVSAVERAVEAKPDSATVSALRNDIREVRVDIRELRQVLQEVR